MLLVQVLVLYRNPKNDFEGQYYMQEHLYRLNTNTVMHIKVNKHICNGRTTYIARNKGRETDG